MSAIGNNQNMQNVGTLSLDQFRAFVEGDGKPVSGGTVIRLGGTDRAIYPAKGDFAGNIGRSQQTKDLNNAARTAFKNAIADVFGGEAHIPESVKKAMKFDTDFGKGKPLTARRIRETLAAVDLARANMAQALNDANPKSVHKKADVSVKWQFQTHLLDSFKKEDLRDIDHLLSVIDDGSTDDGSTDDFYKIDARYLKGAMLNMLPKLLDETHDLRLSAADEKGRFALLADRMKLGKDMPDVTTKEGAKAFCDALRERVVDDFLTAINEGENKTMREYLTSSDPASVNGMIETERLEIMQKFESFSTVTGFDYETKLNMLKDPANPPDFAAATFKWESTPPKPNMPMNEMLSNLDNAKRAEGTVYKLGGKEIFTVGKLNNNAKAGQAIEAMREMNISDAQIARVASYLNTDANSVVEMFGLSPEERNSSVYIMPTSDEGGDIEVSVELRPKELGEGKFLKHSFTVDSDGKMTKSSFDVLDE